MGPASRALLSSMRRSVSLDRSVRALAFAADESLFSSLERVLGFVLASDVSLSAASCGQLATAQYRVGDSVKRSIDECLERRNRSAESSLYPELLYSGFSTLVDPGTYRGRLGAFALLRALDAGVDPLEMVGLVDGSFSPADLPEPALLRLAGLGCVPLTRVLLDGASSALGGPPAAAARMLAATAAAAPPGQEEALVELVDWARDVLWMDYASLASTLLYPPGEGSSADPSYVKPLVSLAQGAAAPLSVRVAALEHAASGYRPMSAEMVSLVADHEGDAAVAFLAGRVRIDEPFSKESLASLCAGWKVSQDRVSGQLGLMASLGARAWPLSGPVVAQVPVAALESPDGWFAGFFLAEQLSSLEQFLVFDSLAASVPLSSLGEVVTSSLEMTAPRRLPSARRSSKGGFTPLV